MTFLRRAAESEMRKFWIILAVLLILIIVASRVFHFLP
jgi:hypothetical protein